MHSASDFYEVYPAPKCDLNVISNYTDKNIPQIIFFFSLDHLKQIYDYYYDALLYCYKLHVRIQRILHRGLLLRGVT